MRSLPNSSFLLGRHYDKINIMAKRLAREIKTVQEMIRIYCKGQHRQDCCRECLALLSYAEKRISGCVFGMEKPVCSECPVHCYSSVHREMMRKVMRYSGPQMGYRHPILTIRHFIDKFKGWSRSKAV
jgi:hypothetical protein